MPAELATAEQPPAVDEPKHKLSELTTFELNTYLRQLGNAVAFFERTQAPILALMRDKLAKAEAEQADRVRLAHA